MIQFFIFGKKLWNGSWYHSVQNILSSSLLPKNIKIKIYRNKILPVFLYGCDTWSIALSEELRLRLFENRVLRIIFRPKMGRSRREMETTTYYRAWDIYCSHNIIWEIKSRRMKLAEHVARMGRGEEHTGIWWENLREREHLEDPDVCGKT